MELLRSILRPRGRDRVRNVEEGGGSGDTLPYPPGPPPALESRQATVFAPEPNSQLASFRHLIGIHSTKVSTQNSLHFDGRVAPNLGIYNRVCHRESQAKRGFKFASLLINSCLGAQIVVAAALTAMGAANTDHVAVTAFGAINTIIAGILTYLKGSGLPNRIRWYENEWKRIREYIEQRERDFSRPDCKLDVGQVVEVIEAMYEEVKADIQTNTPESYVSISDIRARSAAATNPQIPKLQNMIGGTADRGRNKLEDLELKYGHKVTDFLENLAHKEEERLKRIEGGLEGAQARALAALQDKGLDHARTGARDWEKEMEEKGARVAERELEHARSGVLQRGVSFARDLDAAKSGVTQRGNDLSRDLESAKTAALQRGRDYERDVEAKGARLAEAERELERDVEARTARLAEAERELEREAERTRDAAQRAGDSMQRAGDSFQRAGDSIQRIGQAVDDEIQPHRRI